MQDLASMAEISEHSKSYHKDKMVEFLMADDNLQSSPVSQSRCKCIVGKYARGEASEAKCRKIAENIADVALSDDFSCRVRDLRACSFPQHFACCCRLMIDDLMKCLPAPDCAEAVFGADDLANFAAFLWKFTIIPLLMTNGDASYCTGPVLANGASCSGIFVKIFTAQLYGDIGENDSIETKYIIDKLPGQIDLHYRKSYEAANRSKFAVLKRKLLHDGGLILMEFLRSLDARCVPREQFVKPNVCFVFDFCVQASSTLSASPSSASWALRLTWKSFCAS
jgi:hypothetical protein